MITSKDFYFETFHLSRLPIFYSKLINTYNNDVLLSSKSKESIKKIRGVHLISDVPSYLEIDNSPFKVSKLKKITVRQHNGLLLHFNSFNSFDDFFKQSFGSSTRQLLRRGIKVLNTSFNSSHKIYFGNISKNEYKKIFNRFYILLKRRFVEKKINNGHLNNWDYFTNLVYPKILNKTASLFVVYDGDIPIAISLNFHLDDIVFPHIVTYDVDYSKFRIGHTLWIYFITWCFDNQIGILDLSKGNYPYLQKLANKKYQMDYHIFFNPKDISSLFKASLLFCKLKIKQFVRDYNIHVFVRNIISKINNTPKKTGYINYTLKKLPENLDENMMIKINFKEDTSFYFLKRAIYDVLYKTSDNIKEIAVFKVANSENNYYYKGKNNTFQILIKQ